MVRVRVMVSFLDSSASFLTESSSASFLTESSSVRELFSSSVRELFSSSFSSLCTEGSKSVDSARGVGLLSESGWQPWMLLLRGDPWSSRACYNGSD